MATINHMNWHCHLLTRADGLVLDPGQKEQRFSTGKGIPLGVSPSGVLWFCYHPQFEQSMRDKLDRLWHNALGIDPYLHYGAK